MEPLCINTIQLDTLKIRAYGVKNPAHIKEEKEGGGSQRQYPKTKEGNYDEWAALLKNQNETALVKDITAKNAHRALLTNEYGKNEYLQGLERKKQEHHMKQMIKAAERRVTEEQY